MKRGETIIVSIVFMAIGVLYHVHTYTVAVSNHVLYMNQVPEKLYFGQ